MAVLYTPHFVQFLDNNNVPLAGGKLYTYAAGTNTPKATYTTAAGNIENTNPVELDSYGRAIIFLDGSYKFALKDENDVAVGPNGGVTDNVTSFTALDSQSDPFFESLSGNGTQTAFTVSESLGTDERSIYVWVDSGLQAHQTNGTFASDTAWTKGSGWTIGAGVATATGAISTAISQNSAVTLVEGQAYTVTMTITASAGSLTASVGGRSGTARNSSGTYVETIVAGSTQVLAFTGAGFTGTLDNVTVTPAVSKGYQILPPSSYTISGTTLTFNTAPATGTGNILVSAPLLLVGAAATSAAAAQVAEAAAVAAQLAAETAETNAETAETNAEAAQVAAEAAAASASNQAAALSGTSTTSLAIGTGGKSFTTQTGKEFDAGNWILATSDADPTNFMHGYVSSYSGTSLTLVVTNVGGSGTHADWTLRVSGTQGATGATGATGPAGTSSAPYRTTSSTTTLAAADLLGRVELTGSTNRTWDITAAATLTGNWSCVVHNNSTAILTLDPNSTELIDGLSTLVMYPGEMRRVDCTGTAFKTAVLNGFVATFDGSGSFTVPTGYRAFMVELISSGQSGASRTTTGNAGGGAGGLYCYAIAPTSSFVAAGSTETVTVGGTSVGVSGNSVGNAANASSITINGVTYTTFPTGVSQTAPETAANASPAAAGRITTAITVLPALGSYEYAAYGGDVTAGNAPQFQFSGSQHAMHGGGGGGASASTAGGTRTGGTSTLGGAGGAGGANTGGNGTNGTAPGGGGGGAVQGGTSGSGAAGRVVIRGIL